MTDNSFEEARVWVGSRAGYHGREIPKEELLHAIASFQGAHEEEFGYLCSARVTPTEFVVKDYREAGHEVAVLSYPRFPRPRGDVLRFAERLARHLLAALGQNRVGVALTSPAGVVKLYQRDSPEEHP